MQRSYTGNATYSSPSGKAGKAFVSELARLFRAYGEGSTLESVALTAVMIMPALLLQKPHVSSKNRDHVACLQRRLISWQEGDIDSLVREGRTIQRHLRQTNSCLDDMQRTTRIFTRLMFQGKVKAAMRFLSSESKGTSLTLDSLVTTGTQQPPTTVRDELAKNIHQVSLHTQVPYFPLVTIPLMSTLFYLNASMV